ncbi:hypothetical protein ATN84_01330 [Paramesorhizobium deserti]|uniref:Uncharacterized protein n=1 Tax=Paramesorhizobium deserti TaxID=1494590 RepID=A0A135HZ49_9HYPH|nr:hypothetical protein [Paramesorhizobium deserti]KXF78467.1 hypothetical protein ATN84_01330 [Paramesorhizobium deserti]
MRCKIQTIGGPGRIDTCDSRDDGWKKDQPITLPGRVILFCSAGKTSNTSRGHGSGLVYFIEKKKEGDIRKNAS